MAPRLLLLQQLLLQRQATVLSLLLFTLLLLLKSSSVVICQPNQLYKDGDIIIGAVLSIHDANTTRRADFDLINACGDLIPSRVLLVSQFRRTIAAINSNPNLLPGVKLGYNIIDACSLSTVATVRAMQWATTKVTATMMRAGANLQPKPVAAVIGTEFSRISSPLNMLLQQFKIPQIDFGATSADLSDRRRYRYYARTSPSDVYQARAMASLAYSLGWQCVHVVYSQGQYGEYGVADLKISLAKLGICTASESQAPITYSAEFQTDDFDRIVANIEKTPSAAAIICFCEAATLRGLMISLQKSRDVALNLGEFRPRFVILAGDAWGTSTEIPDGLTDVAAGAITLRLASPEVADFNEWFATQSPFQPDADPWFLEFWEEKFRCTFRTDDPSDRPRCKYDPSIRLKPNDLPSADLLGLLTTAIYATANGLQEYLSKVCSSVGEERCTPERMLALSQKGTKLYPAIANVSFELPKDFNNAGQWFQFDENGDGPARYEYHVYRRLEDAETPFGYVKIGEWSSRSPSASLFQEAKSLITWPDTNALVTSVCACRADPLAVVDPNGCHPGSGPRSPRMRPGGASSGRRATVTTTVTPAHLQPVKPQMNELPVTNINNYKPELVTLHPSYDEPERTTTTSTTSPTILTKANNEFLETFLIMDPRDPTSSTSPTTKTTTTTTASTTTTSPTTTTTTTTTTTEPPTTTTTPTTTKKRTTITTEAKRMTAATLPESSFLDVFTQVQQPDWLPNGYVAIGLHCKGATLPDSTNIFYDSLKECVKVCSQHRDCYGISVSPDGEAPCYPKAAGCRFVDVATDFGDNAKWTFIVKLSAHNNYTTTKKLMASTVKLVFSSPTSISTRITEKITFPSTVKELPTTTERTTTTTTLPPTTTMPATTEPPSTTQISQRLVNAHTKGTVNAAISLLPQAPQANLSSSFSALFRQKLMTVLIRLPGYTDTHRHCRGGALNLEPVLDLVACQQLCDAAGDSCGGITISLRDSKTCFAKSPGCTLTSSRSESWTFLRKEKLALDSPPPNFISSSLPWSSSSSAWTPTNEPESSSPVTTTSSSASPATPSRQHLFPALRPFSPPSLPSLSIKINSNSDLSLEISKEEKSPQDFTTSPLRQDGNTPSSSSSMTTATRRHVSTESSSPFVNDDFANIFRFEDATMTLNRHPPSPSPSASSLASLIAKSLSSSSATLGRGGWTLTTKAVPISPASVTSFASSPPSSPTIDIQRSWAGFGSLLDFVDIHQHCKGGSLESALVYFSVDRCKTACRNEPTCVGISISLGGSGFCFLKNANCQLAGPSDDWTFLRRQS